MSTLRKIWFFSGARSDYDLMAPVISELSQAGKTEVGVLVGAAQLSPFHGSGVHQIEEDGVTIIARIESLVASESWAGRSLSFAHLTEGITRTFQENRPALLFVAGDREEHLAAALVANFFRIPVAHLHGGDRALAADIDEVIRPAISKLAHLHFPATQGHRERLIRMGENPDLIWACGAPGLDRLRTTADVSDTQLSEALGFDATQPFFLVIQHPSPMLSDAGNEDAQMSALLKGVLTRGIPVLCGYPNADPGNVGIRNAIDRMRTLHPQLFVYHNLPREQFVSVYRRCAAIIGNSSSLVIESAFLKKPALLVGQRQDLRDAGANVLRLGFDASEISAACHRIFTDPDFHQSVQTAESPYGDGKAAHRIARILESVDLHSELLLKTMPY